jgi:hypothetical protein
VAVVMRESPQALKLEVTYINVNRT